MSEFESGRNLGREDREGETQYLRAEIERLHTVIQAAVDTHEGRKMKIARLRAVVRGIIAANDDFRAGLPEVKWEGDPLQDAIEIASKLVRALEQKADKE